MESRIPLPTDSLYKFWALFGTLCVIFFFGALLYVNNSYNERLFTSLVKLAELEDIQQTRDLTTTEMTTRDSLTRLLEIAEYDKHVFICSCLVGIGLGFVGSLYGFLMWYRKLQRYQDQMMELEYYKLRREVSKL